MVQSMQQRYNSFCCSFSLMRQQFICVCVCYWVSMFPSVYVVTTGSVMILSKFVNVSTLFSFLHFVPLELCDIWLAIKSGIQSLCTRPVCYCSFFLLFCSLFSTSDIFYELNQTTKQSLGLCEHKMQLFVCLFFAVGNTNQNIRIIENYIVSIIIVEKKYFILLLCDAFVLHILSECVSLKSFLDQVGNLLLFDLMRTYFDKSVLVCLCVWEWLNIL